MTSDMGEIASIAFSESDNFAVITFATGGTDHRRCELWQASEWAGAAGLTIVQTEADYFRWEQPPKPVTDLLD
jgi:hypothetical protein